MPLRTSRARRPKVLPAVPVVPRVHLQAAHLPAAAGVGSSSNKIYDKEDVNKDGKVSFQEDQAYKLKHPESVTTTASTKTTAHVVKSDSDSRYIDTFA